MLDGQFEEIDCCGQTSV